MAALRLSLCMIVRDEAAMLPDLLASVAGLWDELVVADTGSTDGTVALLAAAGARIVHHPWDDDFAAARNASLDAARGRWILCLDADERVSPALREQIRALLDDPRAGAATVVMRNALPGGHHRESSLLRLFRNDPAIRFRHRIHEDVLDDVERHLERTGLVLRHLTGFVEHLGYVREVAADRAKKARDEALLRRTLAEDPDDLYCWFKLLELARFWEDEALGDEAAAGAAQRLAGALPPALRRTLARNPWSGELAVLIARRRGAEPATALAWLDGVAERICPGPAWHL
ncbi:glycosyltransferase family 2 protein, partial [bacterium]|nr:glycosyltransferase family 2 protein [bacterium]